MKLYGLKTCDTCRKAMKAIENATFIDVRADGVPNDILEKAYAQFGDKLLNTRSTTWRGLDETDRARAPLDLIRENPTLMKRPLIDTGDALFLGWTADVQKALG